MKRVYIIFLIMAALLPTACSDFLDEQLQGTYSNATFYKTEAHALLAVNAIYNVASFVSTNNDLWVFGDVASDDAAKGGQAGDQTDIQNIDDFTYQRNNSYLEKFWKHYYEGISRANYLLYYGNNIDMDVELRNRVLGEAKFLRAYFYFNLVNVFGEIPLKLMPPINSDEINKPLSSVDVVYTQIIKDLEEAAPALDDTYSGADVGRVTKGAAYGMLAKAHLYRGEWQATLDAIDQVDALGLYSLQPVYKNNFLDSTQNNSESLFELQHLSRQTPTLGSHLNQWFGESPGNGYGFNVPMPGFVNAFERTEAELVDPRLDYTVGREGQPWVLGETFDPEWSATGYLVRKHRQSISKNLIGDAGLNYVYLRYADILLMKAEALNELSRPAEALDPLNAVRRRARESYLYDVDLPGYGAIPDGLLPDVTATGQQAVREAIQHERRIELGFEFHRYFDLMRYGRFVAEAALEGTGFSYATHRYFPIPQSERDTNTAL
ncbi:RagB/SusD family nutrient uptake outer membrane protein [Fulvivirgaceae bacterium PWU5]|uniref:RagB/SusD family nutrient uptake outer membrane protein n=1 Tax=Dawidia cretensis TaxID=2782350 RepID=A0AAP2E4V8_9BACT|nr:RagB/SusD family nutrient uptake outer membrane protein [Dawidia cretensis]MBT1711872.1 RagB/SusD family nutrient uptake outer membrane protein [Dawidia cretensis]